LNTWKHVRAYKHTKIILNRL